MIKKKILILGATGFIGRNLVEHFSQLNEFEVIATYNKRPKYSCIGVTWLKADLCKPDEVSKIITSDIDIIVQAAATTSGSKDIVNTPYIHVTDNAIMNSYIFREAFEKKVQHLIFFSCTVMLQSNEIPQKESEYDPKNEIHPRYFGVGHTKLYIEKLCDFYSRIGETKYTAIRHTNIYGPHDKFDLEKSHVMGATITKTLSSTDGQVNVWGTGEEERDVLYVEDLMSMVEKVIKNQTASFGLYNCGYGKAISIKNLVQTVIKESGRNLKIVHDLSMPTIKTSLSLDCRKAKDELGWEPKISLNEGVKKTIEWWLKNLT